jgi:hypothetical protein
MTAYRGYSQFAARRGSVREQAQVALWIGVLCAKRSKGAMLTQGREQRDSNILTTVRTPSRRSPVLRPRPPGRGRNQTEDKREK